MLLPEALNLLGLDDPDGSKLLPIVPPVEVALAKLRPDLCRLVLEMELAVGAKLPLLVVALC